MGVTRQETGGDAVRLRAAGLRVTAPRRAILGMLEEVGGHRAVDELVLALRRAGYRHARTTVYNALEDLARAGLVRAAPVDAGALRYEAAGERHHHFVCHRCGLIENVPIAEDLRDRKFPFVQGAEVDEIDVVYRGLCDTCAAQVASGAPISIGLRRSESRSELLGDSAEGRESESEEQNGEDREGFGAAPMNGRLQPMHHRAPAQPSRSASVAGASR
jgi:Fe2+ or Zn2+ uptake regulation protein